MSLSNALQRSNLEVIYFFKTGTFLWCTDWLRIEMGRGMGAFGPRIKYSESMREVANLSQADIYVIDRCDQLNLNRVTEHNNTISIQTVDCYGFKPKIV